MGFAPIKYNITWLVVREAALYCRRHGTITMHTERDQEVLGSVGAAAAQQVNPALMNRILRDLY